jgi:glycosyltransferase involved in cell wall biosynthesis
VIEMMSIGIPILGYKNTATHEIAGNSGIFVSARKDELLKGDFPNLTDFVDATLQLHARYDEFSERALLRSTDFSEDKTLAKYLEFISGSKSPI